MPNPPKPINPNIVTGAHTGRVVSDRYDFQKHIIGEEFRHDGYALNLDPPILINSEEFDDVHSAISQLSNLINPPVIPDATTASKGIVRLRGDIEGTAEAVIVKGLRGNPVNTGSPSIDHVLTWDGAAWGPAAPANTFTAGGDLTGTSSSQHLISISGGSPLLIFAEVFQVSNELENFLFTHEAATTTPGSLFTIRAQSTSLSNNPGGDIVLETGEGGGGGSNGVYGSFSINVEEILFQIKQLTTGARTVIGLCGEVNNTVMPADTGDNVIYIKEAITAPTAGVPVDGAILYAKEDGLWTKSQNGDHFRLGTHPNPTIWGNTTDGQIYEGMRTTTTSTGTPAIAITISLLDPGFFNAMLKVEAVIVGKKADTTLDASIHNLTRGYVVDDVGSPTAVGSQTSTDPRTNGGASGWTVPAITVTGTTLQILTGANAATDIRWFVYVKVIANAIP